MPVLENGSDFFFIEEDAPEIIKDKIIELICNVIPDQFKNKDANSYNLLLDIQVLTPIKNSIIGVNT